MARAACRCGQILEVPDGGDDRVICPKCKARVRVRRGGAAGGAERFIRFYCPCGRRLKVSAQDRPTHGKCPDCGRVVPVPSAGTAVDPEGKTVELSPAEMQRLEEWARAHLKAEAGAAARRPDRPRA
jgi:hypothetical protein